MQVNVLIFFSALSQEENESGRFLREKGSVDKTKAGKMMISVGKALSYTAQQRYEEILIFHTVTGYKYRILSIKPHGGLILFRPF